MASIFISYSRKNKEFALRLTEALKSQDHGVWIDLEGIPPTVDWWKQIEKGIEEADIFLFLLSPESAKSDVCRREIEHAAKNGKRLIPIIVRDVKANEAPAELQPLNWIFFLEEDKFNDAFDTLLIAIKTDYEWVQFHRQLQVKALEWDRSDRENSFLLRGKELRDAESQLSTNSSKDPTPTDLQLAFLVNSKEATKRQRRIITSIVTVIVFIIAGLIYSPLKSLLTTPERTYWQIANTFVDQTGITSKNVVLALNPNNPNLIFAADPNGIGAYRTIDGGINWEPIAENAFQNESVKGFAALDNLVYAITSNRVYSSDDSGFSWIEKNTPSANSGKNLTSLAVNIYSQNEVVMGDSNGGIYISNNGGDGWEKLSNQGMIGNHVRAVAVNNKTILAATEQGLWLYKWEKSIWQEVPLRDCLIDGTESSKIIALAIPRAIYGPEETDFIASISNRGLCNSDTEGEFDAIYLEQPAETVYSMAITGDLNAFDAQVYLSTEAGMYCSRVWHIKDHEWWYKKINTQLQKNLPLPCQDNINLQ